MNKPTSQERIDAFMSHAKSNPVKVWIIAWRVIEKGALTWRATIQHEADELTRNPELWRTQFYFGGKEFSVYFYSAHNRFSMDEAILISDMVLKGKTIKHELILE